MKSMVVLGTGPSLTKADCLLVREWAKDWSRLIVGVNCAYKFAPWVDHIYGCDMHFWTTYSEEISKEAHNSLRWSINEIVGVHRLITDKDDRGSGMQAVRLAEYLGAKRVALLGFDWGPSVDGRKHFHEDHPKPLCNAMDFDGAPSQFRMDVTNCSRESRLDWFPRMRLEEWLSKTNGR